MPDFDKDLLPVIKDTSSPDFVVDARGVKNTSMAVGSATATPDLSETPSVFDKLNKYASQTKTGTVRAFVTNAELDANKRYSTYNPTLESQEDFAAYGQSGWEKALNGTLKGTNLAATTIAGGFATLGGAVGAMFTGKLSTIWDNPVMNALDKWNEKVDNELLPNYYTDVEKDSKWYSTDNWMTTNFLFDKLIKNAGFAVGAMYGGNIANAGLLRAGLGFGKVLSKGAAMAEASQAFAKFTPYLRNAARAVSVSENAKAYELLASKIGNIAELESNAAALGQSAAKSAFGELATSTNKFNAFNDASRRLAIATYASGGEASFEALQTSKALRENLIQDYKDSHGGLEPEGNDLDIINNNVSSIGKASFLGNLAILAFTENLQLNKMLGSSYSASRQASTSLLGKVDDVVKRDGVWGLADLGPTTKFGKVYDKVKGVSKYVWDPKEAAQEGLQYALQVGSENYYNKAYRTDDANFLIDGVLKGLEKTLTDKEGIEGMIMGGLTGGIMQAKGTYKQGKATASNTQKYLEDITKAGDFKDAFIDKTNGMNRAIVLQQQHQDAVMNGNKIEAKDLEADQMHNYLSPRIKYGRFDMVKEDINELRRMSMTEQGLSELKAQGVGNINDTVESFQKRLNEFERVASYTNELYRSTHLTYAAQTNTDGTRKYSDDVIDKMVYAASKIADYDVRIPEVNSLLSDYGISTANVLELLLNKNKSNKQSTKEALAEINSIEETIDGLDTIKTIKDELKTQLSDVIEMSARRKLYLSEYDEMVNDPKYFTLPDSEKEAELAKVKQLKETEEGKKKTVSVDLEVGKEYSLSNPIARDGNKLKANPKIKILSKTLGGEFEVQLPSGEITFLKPEQFKQFKISPNEIEDKEASDLLEKAISNVLARPEFKDIAIPDAVGNLETPQEASLTDFLNSSENEALTDAVEAEFAKIAEDYLKEKEEEARKRELLNNVSGEITKMQNEENNLSAFVPTADSNVEEVVKSSNVEPNLRDVEKIFSGTSSQSVEGNNNVKPFVTRFNKFMNAARNFKNRSKLQAIMFTYAQQKALGLDGVIEMTWDKRAGELEGKALDIATDPLKGNVMVVFVQVDKGGKQSFIDADGNVIGEVGKQVDVNKVVVANMATADLEVGGFKRNREDQEEEAKLYLRAWEKYRADVFKAAEKSPDSYLRFNFTISKGKPMINESAPENNSVGETLVSEEAIAKEKVLEVNTKDVISHPDGNNYSVPVGRPYIVFGDMLQIVNNNNLTSNQASTAFSLLKELADTLIGQASGEKVTYDVNKRIFLRNILFMNDQGAESNNKVFLRAGNLHIGSKSYDLTTLGKFEKQITDQLKTVYHTVNNKTLNGGLAKSFTEYYTEGGEIKTRVWKNYQSYLLSAKNPDGGARNVSSIPVTTSVNKKTEAVPYNYTRKYVNLDGLELPVEKVEKPVVAKAEPKSGKQVYPSKSGDVNYTVETGSNGLPVVDVEVTDPTVVAVAKDKEKLKVVKEELNKLDAFNDLDSAEEMVAKYYSLMIRGSITKSTVAEQAVEEAPATEEKLSESDEINLSEGDEDEWNREATEGPYEKMTQYDMDAFKEWAEKNLPVMLYQYVDNALRTRGGKEAFGKLEKGVAYIMKTGARGTEYHEAFHFVFNGFLSKAQRQEILDEFKSRAGSFTDRASGKKIDYVDATDLQAEERIADDFADFRLGKLPARTLSEKVLNFFKGIIDFFKSLVTKKGKIDELFDAIETGQFAERSYPDSLRRVSTKYSEIPGMSEQKVNEAVQDITSRIFSRVFKNNESLFNPERFTSKELFSEVKQSNNYYRNLSDAKWTALIKRTKDFLKTYRIEFDENSAISINDENASKNEYAADAFTVDYKKSSPYAVKLLIGTLIKTKPMDQTTSMGLQLPDPQKSSIEGAQIVPFNTAFATLLNQFENVKDPNVFVEKLVDLAREKSEYVRLFTRLKGNLNTGKIDFTSYSLTDWRLFISTFQVFTKQKPEAIKQFLKDNVVYIGSASQIGSVKEIQDDWINNMIVGSDQEGALVKKTGNYYTIRKNNFKENGKEYLGISNQSIDNPARMIAFLNKLGITFTLDQHKKIKDRKKFSDAVASLKKGLTSKTSPDTVNSLVDRRLDITTALKQLATMYSQVTSTATSTVLLNSEGDQRQEFTESNAPSYFEYMFNSVNSLTELKQKMPQLNDTFSTNSELLREGGRFFNENGDRTESQLKVQYIDGEENLNNGKGRSTSSLSIGDRFTAEINQNIDGNYYVLIPADGSTEWMMNMGNQIDYELFSDGQSGLEQAYKIFQKYLVDEINLARDWKNRQKLRIVGDKAKQLRFFEKILSKDLVNKAEKIINNANATEADINNFIAENTEEINESVKGYIDATVAELKQSLIDNNQVTVSKTGKYTYMGLLSSFAGMNSPYGLNKKSLSEDQFNNILTFVNTNYIINNIEYHKVLFGDPYQFKIKDGILDETKRIKSFLSPRRFTFNMTEYNNKLNTDANTVDGNLLTDEDYGYHEFKDYLKTITASDVNLVSSLAKLFPAYGGTDANGKTITINETDASSWISATAYREVKMKNGQWSDEAEAFHQWQMAYTRQNIPGYKYANLALQAHDIELMKKPMPKYFIEVLKPIVSGNKFNKNTIDLVLDKFSQVPIYYSAVKGTNLESLFEKMFKEKVDYVVVESGRKVGAENLVELYDGNGSFNKEAFGNSIEVPWEAYGIQVENSYDKEKLQTRGSQLTKLATLDLYSEGQPVGSPERQEVIKNAVERNNKALNNLIEQGYVALLKKLGIVDNGDGTYTIIDRSATAELLRQAMFTQQMSINAIDSVTLNDKGQFEIPFEASTNYTQIKNILYSAVNKSINSSKMSGFSGVQISAAMWESSSEGRQLAKKNAEGNWENISKKDYEELDESEKKKVRFTSSALKFYEDKDENGKNMRYCEVLLPNWIRKSLPANMTDEQAIKYLQGVDGGKILKGIGFRIPTQALSSVEVFEIKGFLPEYMGRSVVVPSEITTKAGSDFDIDKLNMYLRAIYKDAQGDVRLVQSKGSEEETKSFFRKVYEDTIQAELDKLSEYDNFRNVLVDILEKLEGLPSTDSETIFNSLSQEDLKFYAVHQNMLQAIINQANDSNVLPSDYMKSQIEILDDVKGEALAKLLNTKLRNDYVDSMYMKSLENEYYDSLEEVLTLPENFNRLVSPNTDATLKDLAKELDTLEGIDEASVSNPMLNRNYMTNLRNAFLTAKKWVGIAAVNITGNSLAQKTQVFVKDPTIRLFLPHNTTNVNGVEHMTLSKSTDKSNLKYISDKLSEYANAFVDVAKDPYILKIIYSERVVGSFMLLERLGVSTETSALFMNQPIIKKYIKYLDSTNQSKSSINDKNNIKRIERDFPASKNLMKQARAILAEGKDLNEVLRGGIKNYAKNIKDGNTSSDLENAIQHIILNEFLTINNLASANYKMSQAINYDTTRFKNADELYRKNLISDIAKLENVFSGIDEILNSSFIGKIKTALNNSTKALGEVLKFNQDEYRGVIRDVLEYYAANQYVSNDKFNRIADKASASFLDYIIYIKSNDLNLKNLLVDADSVANRVLRVKESRNDIKILDYLSVTYREGATTPTKTLKLRNRAENAFDENMLIGYMREMRNNEDPSIVNLYNDIVKLAITQGSYRTPSSIKSIVPLEDYAKQIAPIINNLVVDEDIRNFAASNWFQKNYFNDADVAVEVRPTFWAGKKIDGKIVEAGIGKEPQEFAFGEEDTIYIYYSPSIVTNEDLDANYDNKNLIRLSVDARGAGSNVVVIPRIIPRSGKMEGNVDFITGETVPPSKYAQLRRDLGEKINEKFGYEKVVDRAGNPVFDYDEKGNPYYIYRAINLYGDPGLAVEYNLYGSKSALDNNTREVDSVVPVNDILRTYVRDENSDEEDRDFGTEDLGTEDFKC
jgi:hypothetical protein